MYISMSKTCIMFLLVWSPVKLLKACIVPFSFFIGINKADMHSCTISNAEK